jgi:folate-binding protein YgfZ
MRVIETGDLIMLDVEGFVGDALASRLETLIFSEDVQVRNLGSALAEFGVHGPKAGDVIAQAAGIPAADLIHPYDNLARAGTTVVRDDSLGVAGFDIYIDCGDAAGLRARLLQAGAISCSVETAETLRIEAGRPRFGVDMDTDTIPLEAGIEDRAISLTKGCYVGQEVIVRVLHRGHGRVARRLVGLVQADGALPAANDQVFFGDQEVGRITSAATSPKLGAIIALAYVHRDHSEPGTDVVVATKDGRIAARVRSLPFSEARP